MSTISRGTFDALAAEINKTALPLIEKRARKNFLDAKIVALGGKLAPDQRRSMKVGLLEKEQQRAKLARQQTQDKDAGVSTMLTKATSYREILKKRKAEVNRKRSAKNAPRLF